MPGERHCPLCSCQSISQFSHDARRSYLLCGQCRLVFVPPQERLDRERERAEYDLHCNAVDDPGYRKFLSRLADPLVRQLAPGARGLDFGCGPGPALACMLREAGFEVALYDSFYHADSSLLTGTYDFICATEVVEHLHQPGEELERLWSLLRPGGWLGVMTRLWRDREAFEGWHYTRDPTHVCFFSADTWTWWAAAHRASLERPADDVILLRKPDFPGGG